MKDKYMWIITVIVVLLSMLFLNRKVRLFSLIKEQLQVFRNNKTKKLSLWDCVCFFVSPVIVAVILVYKLNFSISVNLANLLTTVFSIVFTVLFGFAAIMISKIDSQNKIEKQVAEETFVSIVSTTILSLFAAVLSIALTQIVSELCSRIISTTILTLALIIIMLILLITKRTFFLYIDHKTNE